MSSPATLDTHADTARLAALDHAHVWHPFTAMRQWRATEPLIIDRAEGFDLIDTEGRRYLDGVSSLWCNVHGHRDADLDAAVRQQLDKVAHTTMLGLSSPPAIELAARLAEVAPGGPRSSFVVDAGRRLTKTFYSDAGATALEVAFKMAVGYWHHAGRPDKRKFVGLRGAYHGDTTGAMSVGYSDLFHRPFSAMVFDVAWFDAPDAVRPPAGLGPWFEARGRALCEQCRGRGVCGLPTWPSECPSMAEALREVCLADLERLLKEQADETAAVVLEPVMQGAAGMVPQPAGFVAGVRRLCDAHGVLLIADEVAVGFGRTGALFACEHDRVVPDLLCLGKGITGGYLPLAATMATDAIDAAFTGELADRRTLFHGHTYTGNPLACAVALASLDKFDAPVLGRDGGVESPDLLSHVNASSARIAERLGPLRDCRRVRDVRQRGVMVGIEVCADRDAEGGPRAFDFAAQTARRLSDHMRSRGVIVRNLGDVVILMPILRMPHADLDRLCGVVVETILDWPID